MNRLKIGISFTPVKMHNYTTWFARQGLNNEVELVSLNYWENNTADFKQCDGFLLTGGDDIDPDMYGGEKYYANKPATFNTKRDIFETSIFKYSQQHLKPLLGICRGLQLVNVILGGKLIQDLGTEANVLHSNLDTFDKQHEVTIVKNTLLHQLCGLSTGVVNSAHHQMADPQKTGSGLIINAVGHNGEIEGLEFADKSNKPFMLLVQWHPERMADQQNELSKNIIHTFTKAITTG